ncbi:MAG TPA: wax ester/triacylglycerol synthase domain-containing protein, partial [Rhizobacter sp.]|nr:wax ester/triacylglycerol synthase domain-containing protein [Rhizobacter sp.]
MNPLDPVDAAWLHMDGPANPAIVTMVAITAKPLSHARLRGVLDQRLLFYERFRQRVVETGWPVATPVWEDVPDFDIDRHLHRVALPAPHDEQALLALVSELASQPLDHALPLWQVHVVEHVGRGGAMVFRYHHCIGDGLAMMSVASRVFAVPRRRLAPAKPASQASYPSGPVDLALGAVAAVSSLATVLLKPSDPPSPFKGRFAAGQRVAWSRPVSIADAKAIGA